MPDELMVSLDERIELHVGGLLRDLRIGQGLGQIFLPLRKGRLPGGRIVYFVLSDTSDRDFAKAFGILHADVLDEAPDEIIEDGSRLESGRWEFVHDPGRIASSLDGSTQPNPEYSPLKRIYWRGRDVIVNAPFVKWGDDADQRMALRGTPDDINTVGCEGEAAFSEPCGFAIFELHRAVYRSDEYPYLVYFAASDESVAQKLGVTYVPKLNGASQLFEDNSTGFLINFRNGVRLPDGEGGLDGFQFGVTGYGSPTMFTYTPIVEIQNAAFNCGEQRGPAFEPGIECPERAKRLTGDEEGFFRFNDLSVASTGIRVSSSPKSERVILIVSAPVSVRP